MLTRVSRTSDVAPDVSVFPLARDPRTGGRQLEHLAFEVVSTESLGHAGRKAAKLVARGVRRVFAIDIERGRVLEWSGVLETWSPLERSATIEDPVLAAPLPIEPLVVAAKADDAMARALLIKANPVLEAAMARSRLEGEREGSAKAVLAVLVSRGMSPDPADRARILGERDLQRLERWLARAVRCASMAELFAEP